jgi:hypothetical protein
MIPNQSRKITTSYPRPKIMSYDFCLQLCYGLAYKSGLCKIALLSTSFQLVGQEKWSYITLNGRSFKQIKEQEIILSESLNNFAVIESNITLLTQQQRCHDWFISCKAHHRSVVCGVL